MRLLLSYLRRPDAGERGQVTAYFIGLSLLLFAIMAISFDLGLLHLQRRVAQNSVDPAALAGAAYLERCPLSGQADEPLDVAEDFASRNLGVGSNFTASSDQIQTAIGSFHIENEAGEADWQTVRTRVDREQNYIFGRALGLVSATVPAEAEATCGPISEGNICPYWIEGDPLQEPAYDLDGNVISAYGLNIGSVYGMKVNNSSEHYGALDPPNGNGVNAWRDFIAGGCEGDVQLEVCEGCVVENQPGDYGNPVHQALEGGGPIHDALYDAEKTYGTDYPAPNLFPNGHLDCDLALTLDSSDETQVLTVRNYDASGNPTGANLTPEQTIAAINAKTNPDDMAVNSAPCGAIRQDGSVVPELMFTSVQGRFMYIAMTDGECQSACDLPVLGILRMYIVCWTNQEDSAGGNINPAAKLCVPNQPPSQTTIYGVFADFKAPNLLGGSGIGTNPLAPFHVVLVR